MATHRAFVMLEEEGKAGVVSDRPVPKPREGFLLVKTKAVALNPTDWKHVDWLHQPGLVVGCDFAGVVEELGTGYTKDWKVGDRIAGLVHGSNALQKDGGAFAEHVVAKADICFKIPDSMSFEEAATFGVSIITCGQGLFQAMKLNFPDKPTNTGEPILIYGGSSGMGSMGIQYAKLAGYTPITTCSPRNFDFVKKLGAAEAFDYNDPECAEKIKKYTNNNLKLVWDTIGLESTAKICADAIAPGGKYGTILETKLPRDDVTTTVTMGYTAMGEPVKNKWVDKSDNREDYEFAKSFVAVTEKILAEGKLKAHPPKVSTEGLDGILEGLDLMRHDKVSGQKLVYVL